MDSLIHEAAPRVSVKTADTWVVTYGKRSPVLRQFVWSAEAFLDLNEAVEFYGDIENGERLADYQVGSITAYAEGVPIGALPLRRVGAMVREGRRA